MSVRDILAEWLKANGFDELCNEFGCCGCGLEDIGDCNDFINDCLPAYKRIATEDDIDEDSNFEVGDTIFSTKKGAPR